MSTITRMAGIGAAALLSLGLVACQQSTTASSDASASEQPSATSASASTQSAEASAADVRALLDAALETKYDNMTFSIESESSATSTEVGQTQKQSVKTSMQGELAPGKPAMHMLFSSSSTARPDVVSYEMFIDGDELVVKQNDKLYGNIEEGQGPQDYIKAISDAISAEDVHAIIDASNQFKIEESDDQRVITMTADPSLVSESGLVDISSLPEGTQLSTLVANYTIGSDGHIRTARFIGSTSGTPTYRVIQSYQFSKYDETQLPEMPDLSGFAAEQSGLLRDDNGQLYYVDENGETFYVDHIDDDGTVYFKQPEAQGEESVVAVGPSGSRAQTPRRVTTTTTTDTRPEGDGTTSEGNQSAGNANPAFTEGDTSANGGSQNQSGAQFTEGDTSKTEKQDNGATFTEGDKTQNASTTTNDQGRAYITGSDGKRHYLDEPGSEIRNVGGSRVFIDSNGEWYFLEG